MFIMVFDVCFLLQIFHKRCPRYLVIYQMSSFEIDQLMDPIYYLTGMKSLELTDEGLRETSSIRLRLLNLRIPQCIMEQQNNVFL